LLHRPAALFLDEPSLGLDVPIRREVWNYIARLREEGTTIFLCTNYMDEAERLCDEVAIIDRGRVAALGSPEMLRSQLKGDVVSIEISSSGEDRQRLEALERAVSRLQIVKGTVRDGTVLRIYVESDDKALTQIVEAATALTIPIDSITHSRPGLDEVFLRCTGRALAEETNPHG
jgi:ABC-2 type transport system ATP-binding protein